MTKDNQEFLITREDKTYEVVIGLEVHAQVTSQSKLFSTSATKFLFMSCGKLLLYPFINFCLKSFINIVLIMH